MKSLSDISEKTGSGVFHAREWGLVLESSIVDLLIAEAETTKEQRARLCMHPRDDALEQQMLIVVGRSKPYPPHCHPAKQETLISVRGSAIHEIYSPDGKVTERITISPSAATYVNTPAGGWHSLSVVSEWFAFWEIASGPYTPKSTVRAPWLE